MKHLIYGILLLLTMNAHAHSVAFLGVQFINDHQDYEPTSSAEKARLILLENQFKKELSQTGKYHFVVISKEIQKKIMDGPVIGSCGGCEMQYGLELKADYTAWLVVQKVSNLILNINVYMADSKQKKIIYVKSADIRGNTDESWMRGLKYILQNYLLKK